MTDSQALLDELRVRRLIEQYFFAIDGRDEELLSSCFTADAIAQYHKGYATEVSLNGAQQIARFLLDRISVYSATNHLLSNSSVEINGETAEATTHAIAHVIVAAEPRILVRGLRYEDDLLRTGNNWLIRRRAHVPLWQYEVAAVPPAIPLRQ